jgi:hypothetical protein
MHMTVALHESQAERRLDIKSSDHFSSLTQNAPDVHGYN